jgi:uroporphyrinogen III methyltransferase/synthase
VGAAPRIVLTGAREGSGRLAARLRGLGYDVAECPLIRIELLPGPRLDVSGYDWVVLTSARAVDPLLARAHGPLPQVAAVGPGTAEALRERGIEAAVVAAHSTQEGLVRAMRAAGLGATERVLFAGAEGARDVLVRELGADAVALYRAVEELPGAFPAADLVVLASASAARAFARLGLDLSCVSIGPVTSAEARRHGLRVVREAVRHDLDGLVDAVRVATSEIG